MADPVRFSELKRIDRSPAHYLDAIATPRSERPSTPAQLFGTAVHSLVLGGDLVVYPGESRKGNAWKAFRDEHRDRPIITLPEHRRAQPVADAVRNEPVVAPLFEGRHEVELEWTFCGRRCAGRIDVLGDRFVTDLKTAADAHPERLRWQALRLGYVAQLAWYAEGARQNGLPWVDAYLVAVETKAPYPVTPMRLTDAAMEHGMRQIRLWMERLKVCEESQSWPGYVQSVVDLDVPDDDAGLVWGDEGEAA